MPELPPRARKLLSKRLASQNINCLVGAKALIDLDEFGGTGYFEGVRRIKPKMGELLKAISYCVLLEQK